MYYFVLIVNCYYYYDYYYLYIYVHILNKTNILNKTYSMYINGKMNGDSDCGFSTAGACKTGFASQKYPS